MTHRSWSVVVWLAAFVVGEGAVWLAMTLGVKGWWTHDLIMWGVIVLVVTVTRRVLGLPAYRPSPYSEPGSLTRETPDRGPR